MQQGEVRLVYRCKDDAERRRRLARADSLMGKPFIQLPGKPPQHSVALVASDGTKVRVKDVEMVYNDMLLMDAISDYGQDGPPYRDTLDTALMREVLKYAFRMYPASTRDRRSEYPSVQ